jgi:hypothetical protein
MLANKTSAVFNSVPFNPEAMSDLLQSVSQDIETGCAHTERCYHSHRVTHGEIIDALKSMKNGKRDGTEDFSSKKV